MANQSVLELAVGTGKWDAGLKKAKQSLDNFTQANGGLQQALGKDSESMQKFVRMMGQMDSTAKTAKGQMNDYKSTIEQLTMQYNRMTEAQKKTIGQDYLQAIDQMKQKYQAVSREVQQMNQSLNNISIPEAGAGGGLFSGMGDKMSGAIQVFAGNMMTKAAGAVAELGSEIFASVQQGIELARQGEGIRNAFERLGRGDILDGLRQATHGTVTDIELMKAAVKFNDFKLPVEELGTMLAFAQQKAKDTGQSVDYMVDSIVTGLGRKSLMILDNLGLSATEVKEKMAETGDMTKAVGAIIREQMSKAGDYVETAADRAAQADVELKNSMEELGRTFQPLTDASNSLWNSIKVGALDALNIAVKPLIQALAEAGTLGQGARSSAGFNNLGGNTKVDRMIGRLGDGKSAGAYSIYQQQLGEFDKFINNKRFQIAAYGGDNSSVAQSAKAKLQTELDGALKMREEYVKRAQELHNQVPSPYEPPTSSSSTNAKGGSSKISSKSTSEYIPLEGSIDAQTMKVQELQRAWRAAADDDSRRRIKAEIDEQQYALDLMTGKIKQRPKMEAVDVGVGIAPSSVTDPFAKMKDIPFAQMKDNLPAVISPLQQLEDHLKELIKLQEEFGGMSESAWQIYQKEIENTKGQIDNFKNGGNDVTKGGKDIAKSWRTAASAISTVGSAMSGLKDPAIDIMTVIGQSIATVALAYADTLAKDRSSKSNIWAFIAAAAAATVSMATTIASIHSSTGYAQGGIVKGNAYSGDNVPALVDGSQMVGLNAGEVVLTAAQTNNLAAGIQNGGSRIQVVGKLSGEQLFICAERWAKRTGKGEFVTWR